MRRIKQHTLAMGQTMSIHAMNMTTEISEAVGILQSELQAHPECDGGLAAQAALKGRPRRHAALYLGRFPDIEAGEGTR